jgi:hypothetical protein
MQCLLALVDGRSRAPSRDLREPRHAFELFASRAEHGQASERLCEREWSV